MALTDIPGIGPGTAEKLHAGGYRTERGLARAKAERIMALTGRSEQTVLGWIEAAQDIVEVEGMPASTPKQVAGSSGRIGERKPDGTIGWDILLGLDLLYIASSTLIGLVLILVGGDGGGFTGSAEGIDEATLVRLILWFTVVHNLVVFGVIPFIWAWNTMVGGLQGAKTYLGLHGGWMAAAKGVAVGLVSVFVIGGLALLAEQLGLTPDETPIDDLFKHVTWSLAIALSIGAGLGEEVLFRGVLQKWTRWWGQALIFGAMHFANAGIYSFVATTIVGLVFGWLRHKNWSLWSLITAHAVYNMTLFSAALLYPDQFGSDEATAWILGLVP